MVVVLGGLCGVPSGGLGIVEGDEQGDQNAYDKANSHAGEAVGLHVPNLKVHHVLRPEDRTEVEAANREPEQSDGPSDSGCKQVAFVRLQLLNELHIDILTQCGAIG